MNQRFNIKILFFTILFFSVNTFSQNINLERMDNEEIEKIIDSLYYSNPDEGIKIVKFYIKKSKKENSNESLYIAYRYASKFYPVPINFKYTDSALIASKRTENKTLITDAYLNKGVILMDESLYQKALDNILIANKYSLELNDNYIINKTTYFIAQNKIYLGLHEDANKELVNCYNYFKVNLNKKVLNEDYKTYYIFSLMSLIDSNTRIGKHQENISLLEEAYDFIYKNNFEHLKPYFISSEGTEAFYNANYNLAIKKLSEAIRLYNDQWPHLNDIFYIGLSNWKLGKRDVAVKYFEEIDKEYDKSKKLNPEFRPAYELLIKYNDSIGNRDKQLKYINTLMSLDKNYEKNYKYLFSKINKEYDTHKLINEKNKIESSLKNQRTIISSILLITILASLFYWNRYNSLQKKYKEKFEEIISQKNILEKIETLAEVESKQEDDLNPKTLNITDKIKITAPKNSSELEFYNKIPGLNPILVQNILQQLEKFEEELRFTDNQMSLRLLSEEFNTNIPYLSKIINVYKGKNFNYYINDLRIDYIIELLKNDATYLNYDIKNLASLAGFTNAVNFSDNFQRKFEIKPSYFIKMMKENIKTHS
ncbi:AraC family transcriptional regulator [Cloacibacterium normanense]|uniref:Helix-turn-helix domain protein n=2 Tax=Cloacibacterium normanense TaxID=237258 RepID=A0A1E5UDA7_9FLAO|nr:AraC family transcriptional regulator [Cloacibacterium normanense]OEL10909.1 helix-turn-helix domain protein [Cloacibacterium normanense]SDO47108.1 AraC-type DNA-binding protein [Cloacibacterium normanense]